MKHFLVLTIAIVLLGSGSALSQFVVTSSVPSDGSVNVPLTGSVSFTFSAPLDTSARFDNPEIPISLLSSEPKDSLVIISVTYSQDLRTISFDVVHTANTDFVWIITAARSSGGQSLALPYALNYTTSSAYGNYSVSGNIVFEGGNPTGAIAALFDRSLFGEEEGNIKIAAVVNNSYGAYTLNYVRDGVYWPIAAKDLDGNGIITPETDLIGFYDPDNDGQPDSIIVSGGNLSGIDVSLRLLFNTVTAKTYLFDARIFAQLYATDQQLIAIGVHADPRGIDISVDGKAFMWVYQFFSPSLNLSTTVIFSSLIIFVDTASVWMPASMSPIPANFIDSDAAMAVAEDNGGRDFTQQHNLIRRTLYGGNFWWAFFPQDSTKIFWIAEYESKEPDNSSLIFRAFVDMVTGQFLGSITDAETLPKPVPPGYYLAQNYPNPFNPITTIEFSIPKPANVTMKIFDVLGREISMLVNEFLPSGTHKVKWDAKDFPGGVYFYRLETDGFVQTKKLILLR
jgi:hypothetical protein